MKTLLTKTLTVLLFLATPCFAQCVQRDIEDYTYSEGSVTYSCPSKDTLNKRALKQAEEQAVIDAKIAADKVQADLEAIDLKSVRSLRALLAKQCNSSDADCQVLKTKEAEAQAVRATK